MASAAQQDGSMEWRVIAARFGVTRRLVPWSRDTTYAVWLTGYRWIVGTTKPAEVPDRTCSKPTSARPDTLPAHGALSQRTRTSGPRTPRDKPRPSPELLNRWPCQCLEPAEWEQLSRTLSAPQG